jgi:hypothetical protein
MATSTVNDFQKGLACPSSNLLLSFLTVTLSSEVETLIKTHLAGCEFCSAELMLLEHHGDFAIPSKKTPDLPMNLRILAESLMSQSRIFRTIRSAKYGLRLAD